MPILLMAKELEVQLNDLSKNLVGLKHRLAGLSDNLTELKDTLEGRGGSTSLSSPKMLTNIQKTIPQAVIDFVLTQKRDDLYTLAKAYQKKPFREKKIINAILFGDYEHIKNELGRSGLSASRAEAVVEKIKASARLIEALDISNRLIANASPYDHKLFKIRDTLQGISDDDKAFIIKKTLEFFTTESDWKSKAREKAKLNFTDKLNDESSIAKWAQGIADQNGGGVDLVTQIITNLKQFKNQLDGLGSLVAPSNTKKTVVPAGSITTLKAGLEVITAAFVENILGTGGSGSLYKRIRELLEMQDESVVANDEITSVQELLNHEELLKKNSEYFVLNTSTKNAKSEKMRVQDNEKILIVLRSKKFLENLIEQGVDNNVANAIVRRGINILLVHDGQELAQRLQTAPATQKELFAITPYDDIDNPQFNAARIAFGCTSFAQTVSPKIKIDRIVKFEWRSTLADDVAIDKMATEIEEYNKKKNVRLNKNDLVEILKKFKHDLGIEALVNAKAAFDAIPRNAQQNAPFDELQFKNILASADYWWGEEIPGKVKESTGVLKMTDKRYVANRVRATLSSNFIKDLDVNAVENLKLSLGVSKEKSHLVGPGAAQNVDPSIPAGWHDIWATLMGFGALPHFQPGKYIEAIEQAIKTSNTPVLDEDFFNVMNRELSEEVIEKLHLRTEQWRQLVALIQNNEQIKTMIITRIPDWDARAQSLAGEKKENQRSEKNPDQTKQCETVLAAIKNIWNVRASSKIPQAIKFFEDFNKLDTAVDVKKMKKELWNDIFKEMSERYNADPSQYQWVNNFIAGLKADTNFVENFKKNFKSQVKMGIIADPQTDPFVVDLVYEAKKIYFPEK